jgi:hypothetical protein
MYWERQTNGTGTQADSITVAQQLANRRRELDREIIRMDIVAIGERIGLSARQQEEYVQDIDSGAARYGVPHLLLHAVCSNESSYDPTAVHPQITVKGRTTRAIGLTGIVWEYHGDRLIAEGIATSRMELAIPSVNIMASAFIIKGMMRDVAREYAVKNKVLSDTAVFREFVRRYYGAYDEAYRVRMLVKIKETAGHQWMKRVAQEMLVAVAHTANPVIGSSTTQEVPYVQQTASERVFLVDPRGNRRGSVGILPVANESAIARGDGIVFCADSAK